tara:strand:+ start:1919 stop:3061 length:1143 start_codon:yes stop_codon:yes gene_type:complete
MKLSDLTPDPNNANKGTERGNSALEASLQQYGAGRSILLDKNNTIIAGNKTAEVAGQIGIENVRVIETAGDELVAVKRTDLDLETDASAREMAYADNRVGELSLDWDADALLNDIENGIDVSKFFSDNEIDKLIGPKPTEDVPAPDATAELQEKWGTERGQVWTIGRHRLMCGDSTSAEDVAQLLDGNKPELMVTDPPYGVAVVPKGGGAIGKGVLAKEGTYREIEGDDKPFDPSHLWDLADDQIIFGANYFPDQLPHRGQWIVWDKDRPEGTTFSEAELAWTSGSDIAIRVYRCTWNGMVREGESGPRFHPTQKPVKLFCDILKDHTGTIIDPYCGSGTTMVAAEQLNRTCYGMEIDPGYCAVILERMNLMGLEGTIAV